MNAGVGQEKSLYVRTRSRKTPFTKEAESSAKVAYWTLVLGLLAFNYTYITIIIDQCYLSEKTKMPKLDKFVPGDLVFAKVG